MRLRPCILALLLACPGLAAAADSPIAPADAELFEARVRPLLVEKCLKCHGPTKQESGLRIDSRGALLEGGSSGPALVPGNPDESLLVQTVRYDADPKMPPPGKLAADKIALLTEWVRRGAPWPAGARVSASPDRAAAVKSHWAFKPIARPAPPAVADRDWPQTAIDCFILAKLEASKLRPSPPADRSTLLRRAKLDLLGLPPTSEEVTAFVADSSPDAYARLIDGLLASPHYGERWGRHWLDVARYADTKGYVFFEEPNLTWAFTYRDYVIEAFNRDLPYDRFLLEQLAADKLDPTDRRASRALGFITVGGRFMANKHDILDDRIDVIARGLLGLTVTCARCHDHKFDPIPSTDYYALYGVLASCFEPVVPPLVSDPPGSDEYRAFAAEMGAREKKFSDFIQSKHAELLRSSRQKAGEYLLAAHAAGELPGTDDFMLLADGNDLNPKMVERWQAFLRRTRRSHHPVLAPWHALTAIPAAEWPQKAPGILDRLLEASSRPVNPLVIKALREKPPANVQELAQRYGELLARADSDWQQVVSTAGAAGPPATLPDAVQEELRQVLFASDSPCVVPLHLIMDIDLLPDRASQDQYKKLLADVEKWQATGAGSPPRAMALQDLPQPLTPRVFVRGNPNNLGASVERHFVTLLAGDDPPPFRDGSGRLELARAIVDRDNPLTARVLVNRLWQEHFGRALVATPSDFGLRSQPPSHPELLDYLAGQLIDGGWSIKRLHRQIMLSSVYMQRSDERPDGQAVDAENALLWKMNRRRLDFESLRDSLVAVSGRLDARVGGQSVQLFSAPFSRRRAVYGWIDRLNMPGLLRTFDYPSADATSPLRSATTVPPQALFMMNHPLVLESAERVLSRPEIAGESDVGRRTSALYRLLYGREPAAEELTLANEFLNRPGAAPPWPLYVQTLLMANEFVWSD